MTSLTGEVKQLSAVRVPSKRGLTALCVNACNLIIICERFLASVRREYLDQAVILSQRHLRRVLKAYVESYFNRTQPHQGLWQAIPVAGWRSVPKAGGKVIPIPFLGGLHRDYQWAV